ncbi:MAG TPA: MarR family transcriptional regulator [Amycolatopsis sp.]|jgi:DNA-binding MarR family transcriptional regulator|nr:MarR family transcriptional regulator [Amycolatopsis sp.]
MGASDEASLELARELHTAGQLRHAWTTQAWPWEDLHPAAAMLLSELATHGECRPSELAKHKMVDISVISRQIAQLSAAGLVDRRPAPEDGRAALVSVSEQGQTELKRVREAYLHFMSTALKDWTHEDVATLAATLRSMNEALREHLNGDASAAHDGK